MMPKSKEVTKTQLASLVFIMGVTSQSLVLPSVMAEDAGRDAWIAMAVSLAIYFLLFMLVLWIYRLNPGKQLYDILKGTIGVAGAKIVYGLYAILFFYKILMLSNETSGFCITRLYMNLPWNLYLVPLYLMMAYVAVKGLNAIARNCELTVLFVLAAIIFVVAYSLLQSHPQRLLPVLEHGVYPVAKTVGKTTIWFGDFFVVLMMFGKIKHGKNLSLLAAGGNALAAVAILFLTISYYGNYGSIAGLSAHGQVLTNMSITGDASSAGILDSFMTIFWLLAVLVKFTAFFWAVNESLIKITGAKRPIYTAVPLAIALYILDTRVLVNDILTKYVALAYINYLAAAAHYVLPAVILVCALVYARKEKGKDGDKAKKRRGKKNAGRSASKRNSAAQEKA